VKREREGGKEDSRAEQVEVRRDLLPARVTPRASEFEHGARVCLAPERSGGASARASREAAAPSFSRRSKGLSPSPRPPSSLASPCKGSASAQPLPRDPAPEQPRPLRRSTPRHRQGSQLDPPSPLPTLSPSALVPPSASPSLQATSATRQASPGHLRPDQASSRPAPPRLKRLDLAFD